MSGKLSFMKMHGCGNDFVVIDSKVRADRQYNENNWTALSRTLLERHYGIGGDQLMLVQPGNGSDFSVKVFNADGSSAGMCGNGIRCVVRYLFLERLVPAERKEIHFEVSGRDVCCTTDNQGRWVTVDMGLADFTPKGVPTRAPKELIGHLLTVAGEPFNITAVGISGTPHCVVPVSDLSLIPFEVCGALLEHHELFPDRANVEFVEVLSAEQIRVRVWERGAGATLACGSGACASLAACVRNGLTGAAVEVLLPGGELEVRLDDGNNHLFLSGPAQEVFSGEVCESSLVVGI